MMAKYLIASGLSISKILIRMARLCRACLCAGTPVIWDRILHAGRGAPRLNKSLPDLVGSQVTVRSRIV